MILLTGASGFIGQHLFTTLINKFGVNGVIALTSKPLAVGKYLLHHNYSFDSNYLKDNINGKITTIIHAGAFIPKSASEANAIQACNSNINSVEKLITSNLPDLEKMIFLSTVDVYSSAELIDENSAVNPPSLYAWSKLYGEQLIKQSAKEKNIVHQILRLGHIYGPGEEHFNKVIPNTMKQLMVNNNVERYGKGEEIRSYLYITDAIEAIIQSIYLNVPQGIINIASNEYITIKNVIDEIIQISQKNPTITHVNENYVGRNLRFDNQKMQEVLHIPKIKLKTGLKLEWDYMQTIE